MSGSCFSAVPNSFALLCMCAAGVGSPAKQQAASRASQVLTIREVPIYEATALPSGPDPALLRPRDSGVSGHSGGRHLPVFSTTGAAALALTSKASPVNKGRSTAAAAAATQPKPSGAPSSPQPHPAAAAAAATGAAGAGPSSPQAPGQRQPKPKPSAVEAEAGAAAASAAAGAGAETGAVAVGASTPALSPAVHPAPAAEHPAVAAAAMAAQALAGSTTPARGQGVFALLSYWWLLYVIQETVQSKALIERFLNGVAQQLWVAGGVGGLGSV